MSKDRSKRHAAARKVQLATTIDQAAARWDKELGLKGRDVNVVVCRMATKLDELQRRLDRHLEDEMVLVIERLVNKAIATYSEEYMEHCMKEDADSLVGLVLKLGNLLVLQEGGLDPREFQAKEAECAPVASSI